ncbi:MAG: protein kinase domain-containing protein [Gammaproteobacteria bacterium]
MELGETVVGAFIAETREQLGSMEDGLLQLEGAPDNAELINAMFRTAHTIKGSAAMFGFGPMVAFTHDIESLLDRVREGEIAITAELSTLLLQCRNHLQALLDPLAAGKDLPVELSARGEGLLAQIKRHLAVGVAVSAQRRSPNDPPPREVAPSGGRPAAIDCWHLSLRFGRDVLRNGMDPLASLRYLTRLGELVHLTTLADGMPPAAEMDPESCYLGFEISFKSEADKTAIENAFEFVRDDCEIRILPPRNTLPEQVPPALENTYPKFTKYRLVRELGRGRTGRVYLAHDALTNRDLSVKLAHVNSPACTDRGQMCKNPFFRESQASGMLMHPNIAAIFDAGIGDDIGYIAMEYVAGRQSLADYCNVDALLPIPKLVRIFYQCATALYYAHKKGVVHGNITPKSILLTPDMDVKLTNIGNAPSDAGAMVPDRSGAARFRSPEQVRGERPTAQSDLFCVGAVMYGAVTGISPFMADEDTSSDDKIMYSTPRPLRAYRLEAPDILSRIVRRALVKDPDWRYKSGLELAVDLSLMLDRVPLII